MTTLQFPRTLQEAFPSTADYACAIQRTRRTGYSTAWWVAMALISVGAAILIAMQ